MKHIICVLIAVGFVAFAGGAQARNVYVAGHYLANGRYVAPHYVTVPDGPAYPGYGPGYGAVDPEGNVAPVPMPYPYGTPYGAPYQAAPYVPGAGYVPNYGGYIPR
jgi:hypothetical protein